MNLLPKSLQEDLKFEKIFHSAIVAASIVGFLIVIGILVQAGVWAYLTRMQSTRTADIERLKAAIDKTENAQLKQDIKVANSRMQDFISLQDTQPKWAEVLESFARLIPNGVEISKFSANAETLKVEISGYSPTRESVIELYNNINSDKEKFSDIDYPLENVSRPTDVEFKFSFKINELLIVPKPQ